PRCRCPGFPLSRHGKLARSPRMVSSEGGVGRQRRIARLPLIPQAARARRGKCDGPPLHETVLLEGNEKPADSAAAGDSATQSFSFGRSPEPRSYFASARARDWANFLARHPRLVWTIPRRVQTVGRRSATAPVAVKG